MGRQNFTEVLMPIAVADMSAVAGTTEGVLWSAGYSALPANFFDGPGKCLRVRAFGVMTTGATPGTLILTPRYGTTTSGTSLGAGATSATLAASVTGVPWFLDYTLVCRSIGTAGTVTGYGVWESVRGLTSAPGAVECGNGSVATIDTTAATGGIVVGATLSNAGSSLTTRKMVIEALT